MVFCCMIKRNLRFAAFQLCAERMRSSQKNGVKRKRPRAGGTEKAERHEVSSFAALHVERHRNSFCESIYHVTKCNFRQTTAASEIPLQAQKLFRTRTALARPSARRRLMNTASTLQNHRQRASGRERGSRNEEILSGMPFRFTFSECVRALAQFRSYFQRFYRFPTHFINSRMRARTLVLCMNEGRGSAE